MKGEPPPIPPRVGDTSVTRWSHVGHTARVVGACPRGPGGGAARAAVCAAARPSAARAPCRCPGARPGAASRPRGDVRRDRLPAPAGEAQGTPQCVNVCVGMCAYLGCGSSMTPAEGDLLYFLTNTEKKLTQNSPPPPESPRSLADYPINN